MKEVKDYSPSKDARLINCKTECGNERCFAKRYGLFAEKTCHNFVEPKPLTNADKLRAMTDEELAQYMGDVQTWGGCPNHGARNCTENCADCWLDWLKQEVSTNG